MRKSEISKWKSTAPWQTPEQARDYHARVYTEQPVIWAKNDIEVDLVLAKCQSGEKVLDLGTGSGRFARPLYRHGCVVTGMDNSQAMLEVCREAARQSGIRDDDPRLVLRHCDIFEGIPAETGTFDRVVSITFVRHFPEWRYVLGEMLRVCRAGGTIIFENCNGDMIRRANRLAHKTRWGVEAEGNDRLHYEAEVPLEELNEALAQAGAAVESVEPYDVFNNNFFLDQLLGERYQWMRGEWSRRLANPEVRDFWRFIGVELLPHIAGPDVTFNSLITARKLDEKERRRARASATSSLSGHLLKRMLRSCLDSVVHKSRKRRAGRADTQ